MQNKHLMVGICLFSILLSGCDKNSSATQQYASASQIGMLDARLEASENRIARLEQQDQILPYKLGDTGFGFIETNTGGGTLQWIGSKTSGNGVQLTLKLGNPSSASWNEFAIIGRHGKLQADGAPDENTSKPFLIRVKKPVPAGSWKTITVQLDGPKVEEVGFIFVRSISISNIGLVEE